MTLRSWAAALLLAGIDASPALADPAMQADGWVGSDGRILRQGEPAQLDAFHPATAGDWVTGCMQRLAAANHRRSPEARYESVCRAWLSYYEQTGETAQGYGFAYAIPVSLVTSEVPGDCPPMPQPVPQPRKYRAPAPDKRVKIMRY